MSTPSTSAVRDYVSDMLNQIKDGVNAEGGVLNGTVLFELATVSESEKGGKVDARVVNFGANVSSQNTHKVTFSVNFPSDVELATDATNIAKAELEKAQYNKKLEALDYPSFRAEGRKSK